MRRVVCKEGDIYFEILRNVSFGCGYVLNQNSDVSLSHSVPLLCVVSLV